MDSDDDDTDTNSNKGKIGLDHEQFENTRDSYEANDNLDYFLAHFYEKHVGNVSHMNDNQRKIWNEAISLMGTIGEIKSDDGVLYKAGGYCKKQ